MKLNHLKKSRELGLPADQYVIVGASVLDIHGIRASNDMDVVVSKSAFQELKNRGWKVDEDFKQKWGRERLLHDIFEVQQDLYYEKINYYLSFEILKNIAKEIDGVYTQPLGLLLLGKLDCGRPKDLADVALIEAYFTDKQI